MKRADAGSFSLKVILGSHDNTKSNDYINNNKMCFCLSFYYILVASLSALHIYFHRSFNPENNAIVVFVFSDEETEPLRG